MTIVASRPLRFVVLLLAGWIGIRAMVLWPSAAVVPELTAVLAPSAVAKPRPVAARSSVVIPRWVPVRQMRQRCETKAHDCIAEFRVARVHPAPALQPVVALAAPMGFEIIQDWPGPLHDPMATGSIVGRPRLAGSAWMIVRGGAIATPFAPQLGGSQAGVRLTYALGDSRRVALAARFSSALGSRQREAGIGFDWKPTALPVHVIAEQRIGIDGTRGGPALGLVAGIGPSPIAGDFRIEAYGQTGAIARGGVEGYADGALRMTRTVAMLGSATVDLGVGAWGGAQRGAARFDIGPAAGMSLPVTGRSLRVSLEWRQRVAGRARPGSGPALTIGTDF